MRRALALLLFSASFASFAAIAEEPPVQRPEVKAGDRWAYRRMHEVGGQPPVTYELTVTFAGPTAIKAVSVAQGTTREIDTTWTAEWNLVTDAQSGSYFPDDGLFRFPLQAGASHAAQYELVRPRLAAFRSRNSLEVKVLGWEEITVPAGRFRALKIEAPGTYQRVDMQRRGRIRYTVWYVPEVRRWVKLSFENTTLQGKPLQRWTEELVHYRLQ